MREPAKKGEVTFTGMTPDQYESYVGVSEYLISEGNTTPGEAAEGLTRAAICANGEVMREPCSGSGQRSR